MLIQLKIIRRATGLDYEDAKEVQGSLMLAERSMDGKSVYDLVLIGPESQVIPVRYDVDPQHFKEAIW